MSKPRSSSRPSKEPRVRRDPETARALILDAAEKHLIAAGPAGIRLQDVAADAGVSHPTVLHYFGTREALVRAVCQRVIETIHQNLIAAIAQSTGEEAQLAAMLDAVYETLGPTGHGRVLMWLALEGTPVKPTGSSLANVVDATHAMVTEKASQKGLPLKTRDDTAFAIVLSSLSLLGSPIIGKTLLAEAGLSDEDAEARFRSWLARLLRRHLESE